jgi:predicted ABC-class ATPase
MRPLTERQKKMLTFCKNYQDTRTLIRKMGISKDAIYNTARTLIEKRLLRKAMRENGTVVFIATQETWPPKPPTRPTQWDGPVVCGVRL